MTPLVETSAEARLESSAKARDGADRQRPRAIMVYAMRRLADDESARALVVGDGDFATNSFFAIMGNGQLFLNAVGFLAEQEDLIDIQPRHYALPRIELTNVQMMVTFVTSSILLPIAVLLAGLVVWWRRR